MRYETFQVRRQEKRCYVFHCVEKAIVIDTLDAMV